MNFGLPKTDAGLIRDVGCPFHLRHLREGPAFHPVGSLEDDKRELITTAEPIAMVGGRRDFCIWKAPFTWKGQEAWVGGRHA